MQFREKETKPLGKPYRLMNLGIICLIASLLAGCDVRKTMGIESKPSDAFSVSPYQKNLEIPPHFELMPPQVGSEHTTPSPAPRDGESVQTARPLTPSEQEVISKLGPGLDLPDRKTMDAEAEKEREMSQKKGLLEKSQRKTPQGEVINPTLEAKNLPPKPAPKTSAVKGGQN